MTTELQYIRLGLQRELTVQYLKYILAHRLKFRLQHCHDLRNMNCKIS